MEAKEFRKIITMQEPRLALAIDKIAGAVLKCAPDKRYKNAQPRALLVGGFTRDILLGLHPKDADMEVFGVAPDELEKIVMKLFGDRTDAVGKSFGVLKIFLGQGLEVDVTLPRRESKTGHGHKGFLVDSDPGLSMEQATRRRDFTMNAIAVDPLTGETIDLFNGIKDLDKRLLRVVDPTHFSEDPLRVYRAVQFVARFGLTVDHKSLTLMKKMVDREELVELSKERITEEIRKLLLKSPKPSIGFELMRELGIVDAYYPELDALTKTEQEPDWHPEGNVWIHTLMALDEAAKIIRKTDADFTDEEKIQIMIGVLCHDLGKPATTAPGEKQGIPRIRSLGHEAAGEEPAKSLLHRWTFGDHVLHAAITVTTQHMHPNNLFMIRAANGMTEAQYTNAVRKLLRRIQPLDWRVFLAASEADYRGRSLPGLETDPYDMGRAFANAVRTYELEEEAKKTLIQGRDIIITARKLGIEIAPGPRFNEIITHIEELRDDGKIKTRTEALDKLRELLGK